MKNKILKHIISRFNEKCSKSNLEAKNGSWTHQTSEIARELKWNPCVSCKFAYFAFLSSPVSLPPLLPSMFPSAPFLHSLLTFSVFRLYFMCFLSLCHLASLGILFLFKSKLLYLKTIKWLWKRPLNGVVAIRSCPTFLDAWPWANCIISQGSFFISVKWSGLK